MKEAYVSYEVAQLLKEKGFDWDTDKVYERNIMACRYEDYPMPTQQMACRWLREEHNIDTYVKAQTGILGVKAYTPYAVTYKKREPGHMYYFDDGEDTYDCYEHFIPVPGDEKNYIKAHHYYYEYEEAVEEIIKYCLTKLIEQ